MKTRLAFEFMDVRELTTKPSEKNVSLEEAIVRRSHFASARLSCRDVIGDLISFAILKPSCELVLSTETMQNIPRD